MLEVSEVAGGIRSENADMSSEKESERLSR